MRDFPVKLVDITHVFISAFSQILTKMVRKENKICKLTKSKRIEGDMAADGRC